MRRSNRSSDVVMRFIFPMLFSSVIYGMGLGFGAAVPIGPVNVEIARRTFRYGFRSGFALGCGAVTIDVLYAVVLAVCSQRITINSQSVAMQMLGMAGAALLFYLAYGCFRSAIYPQTFDFNVAQNSHSHYVSGLLMTSLNPMTLIFWFLVVPATAIKSHARENIPLICLGVFLATISWVIGFAGILAGIRKKQNMTQNLRGIRFCDLAGGVLLLWFGLRTIWRIAFQYL